MSRPITDYIRDETDNRVAQLMINYNTNVSMHFISIDGGKVYMPLVYMNIYAIEAISANKIPNKSTQMNAILYFQFDSIKVMQVFLYDNPKLTIKIESYAKSIPIQDRPKYKPLEILTFSQMIVKRVEGFVYHDPMQNILKLFISASQIESLTNILGQNLNVKNKTETVITDKK